MTMVREKTPLSAGSLSTHHGSSLISNEKLLELYATMLKCRMIEECIRAMSKRIGEKAPPAAASTSIAALAGVALDLRPEDTLAPFPGGLPGCFVKGLPLAGFVSWALGSKAAKRPSFASLHLISPRLKPATQLDRALGAAANGRKARNITVIFCGDFTAASSEFESAMTSAARKKLPILFVYQSSSGDSQNGDAALRARLPVVTVDRDDAVAIYRVATEAAAHARRGSGPTLIECKSWPLKGRDAARRNAVRDPIRNMETYLAQIALSSKKFKSQVTSDFRRELDAALCAFSG